MKIQGICRGYFDFDYRFRDSLMNILSFSVISLKTLQGFPTATTLSGIERLTTDPAPITTLEPMVVTPPRIVQLAPIQTFFPMFIGEETKYPSFLSSASKGWDEHARTTFGAIKQFSPILIGEESRNTQLKLITVNP